MLSWLPQGIFLVCSLFFSSPSHVRFERPRFFQNKGIYNIEGEAHTEILPHISFTQTLCCLPIPFE